MQIDAIKARIELCFKEGATIHMNVSLNHPKLNLRGVPVKIVSVFSHIFMIEEIDTKKRFSIQYADILIGRIEVLEFNGMI